MACHNRRELTLRALQAVWRADAPFAISVVLFDDGSSDGTSAAVRAQFPQTIILPGDGTAFWNGGMHAAWSRALALEPDAYLWLNDDVDLDEDALPRLQRAWAAGQDNGDAAFILVGATRSAAGSFTYGGIYRMRSAVSLRFEPAGLLAETRLVDTFNGNIVLVTAAAVARIGILDPQFFHSFGDIDYGLRARRAGIAALQLPGSLGRCEANPPISLAAISLLARWRHFTGSPRGLPAANWWRMVRRHSGWLAPLHFVLPYRQILFPRKGPRR